MPYQPSHLLEKTCKSAINNVYLKESNESVSQSIESGNVSEPSLKQIGILKYQKRPFQSKSLSPLEKLSTLSPKLASKFKKSLLQSGRSKKHYNHVKFSNCKPDIIGIDGGLGNPAPGEDDYFVLEDIDETQDFYQSLTTEEKRFSLLALGNTVWNSDNKNLLVNEVGGIPLRS